MRYLCGSELNAKPRARAGTQTRIESEALID